jgi:hypothetical protein
MVQAAGAVEPESRPERLFRLARGAELAILMLLVGVPREDQQPGRRAQTERMRGQRLYAATEAVGAAQIQARGSAVGAVLVAFREAAVGAGVLARPGRPEGRAAQAAADG